MQQLREELDQRRQHRVELSESILQDARQRIQELQRLVSALTFRYPTETDEAQSSDARLSSEKPEVTKVLEDLVSDNENLKRDNAELQILLSSSREEHIALQRELEDERLAAISWRPDSPSEGRANLGDVWLSSGKVSLISSLKRSSLTLFIEISYRLWTTASQRRVSKAPRGEHNYHGNPVVVLKCISARISAKRWPTQPCISDRFFIRSGSVTAIVH